MNAPQMTQQITTSPDTLAPSPETARFRLDGMSCASCVGRVERALLAVPGVKQAAANFGTGEARVSFAAPATRAAMAAALAQVGYPVVPQVVTLSVEGMTCAS